MIAPIDMKNTSKTPVFVVGQPRSGSTILTRVLNDIPGLFIINDFYVLQKIDSNGLWKQLTCEQAHMIADWIYRIIEIRAAQEVGKTLEQPIHLTLDQLGELKNSINKPWQEGLLWHEVLSEVMSEAATLAGCDRWGYNTPQDHLHLERLFEVYPGCRVIFMLRNPEAVLASYKNVSGWWHDPRRYNPVSIALAWRAAARSYVLWSQRRPRQVELVHYEAFVTDPAATTRMLEPFLDASFSPVDLSSYGRNSSFSGSREKRRLHGAEIFLCEWIIGDFIERLDFQPSNRSGLSGSGILELLKVFFSSFQLLVTEYLFDRDMRTRLFRLLVHH